MSRGKLVYEAPCANCVEMKKSPERNHYHCMDHHPIRITLIPGLKVTTKTGYVYYGDQIIEWVEQALGFGEEE